MRLKDLEIKTIKDAMYTLYKNARIHLFGSRVDDSKRVETLML